MQYDFEAYPAPGTVISLEVITEKLKQRFSNVRKRGKKITVSFPGWRGSSRNFEIWLTLWEGESIQERADFLAKKYDRPEIARSVQQLYADSFGDPEEQFYNEFAHLTDDLMSLGNLYLFDPYLREFSTPLIKP